jgi:hypothetical protein
VGRFILGSSGFVNWVKAETGLEANIEIIIEKSIS